MPTRPVAVLATLVAMLVAVPLANAHAPKVGRNGGPQTNAGAYHVELLIDGERLKVFVRDHGDKAVATQGFRGTATIVIDGSTRKIPLQPAGDNRLEGAAPVRLPPDLKGIVEITNASGTTARAAFK